MQPNDPKNLLKRHGKRSLVHPDLAKQAQQQQIESEHLMRSLLDDEGLASSVFNKLGINVQKGAGLHRCVYWSSG